MAKLCNSKNIVYFIILILKGKKANSNVTQICNEFKPSVRHNLPQRPVTSSLNKISYFDKPTIKKRPSLNQHFKVLVLENIICLYLDCL